MKAYRGVVKGNTIVLEEKPALPEDCPAMVEIMPIEPVVDADLVRQQIELISKPHRGGKLARYKRGDLHAR